MPLVEALISDLIVRFVTLSGFLLLLIFHYGGLNKPSPCEINSIPPQRREPLEIVKPSNLSKTALLNTTGMNISINLTINSTSIGNGSALLKNSSFINSTTSVNKSNSTEEIPRVHTYTKYWHKIGQPVVLGDASHPKFPPFREESQFISANQAKEILRGAKFFFEADMGPGKKQHYDRRFFKYDLPVDERHKALESLFVEFSQLMDHYNIPYWLDFGSLLGWYWKKAKLPWDDDIDVGIYWNFLFPLTWVSKVYKSNDYLLEVNPNFVVLERLQGNNMIDARFICKKTGAFIDIVAYSSLYDSIQSMSVTELNSTKWMESQYYTDKNNHSPISKTIMFPLKRSIWENVEVWIPADPISKLQMVYGRESTVNFGEHELNYYTNTWRLKGSGGYSIGPSLTVRAMKIRRRL